MQDGKLCSGVSGTSSVVGYDETAGAPHVLPADLAASG